MRIPVSALVLTVLEIVFQISVILWVRSSSSCFICTFLMTNDVDHLFIGLVAFHRSFVKCLFKFATY